MNTKEIERLLEKYYEGETSLSEEKTLREFFCRADIPDHLLKHKAMFRFFAEEQKQEISNPEFDRKLDEALNETTVIRMNPVNRRMWSYVAVAASFLVLVALVFQFRHDIKRSAAEQQVSATVSDSVTEYNNAKQALMFVSSHFNSGISEIRHLEAFDTGLKEMNKLSMFYQYQTLIINPDEFNSPSKKSK